MARPLRIQFAGSWHHVMARGLAKSAVSLDDTDRATFLDLVADARERWGLRTHAACLLDSHIHMLVEDVTAQLPRAMRHVLGVYTQRFNTRHGHDGALFRGRYRSRLVQHERYLAELVRYIHLNPVEAGLVTRAGDYRWSSHPCYLSAVKTPWLVTEEVLSRFGGDPLELDRFVHSRIPDAERAELAWTQRPAILGDDAFVLDWRRRLRGGSGAAGDLSGHTRGWLATTCDEVVDAVSAHFAVERDTVLTGRRGRSNAARQVALLVCCDHTPQNAASVATVLGLNPTSLTALALRYRRRLREDAELAAAVEAVTDRLGDALPTRKG